MTSLLPGAKTGKPPGAATPRKAALGPLTRIAEKGPRTVPLRGPAMPKSDARTPDVSPKRCSPGRSLPGRLPEKGV